MAKKLLKNHKNRISSAINNTEKKLIENYKNVAKMSGEDWSKAGKKYTTKVKKDMGKVRKRVNTEIKKNPEGATIAAAIIGALAGAIIMSKLRKKA